MQRRLVEAVEVTESQIHIVRLKGIFDASTVSEFEKVTNFLTARDYYKMVVDLELVEFISSAGWGAFTAELRRVREHAGDFKLAGMSTDVFEVFLLLELDHFIKAFDTVEEAVNAFIAPEPEPEPEAEVVPIEQEMPLSAVEEPQMIRSPFAETFETRLPAVYHAPLPILVARPDEEQFVDHDEYSFESAEVEIEAEPEEQGIAQPDVSEWDYANEYITEDTLEIDAASTRAAIVNGQDMYDLLLSSSRPTFDPAIARSSPPRPPVEPPSVAPPADEKSALTFGQPFDRPANVEAEFNFSAHEPVVEENSHAATQEFSNLVSETELHFSGHEPIHDEGEGGTPFNEPILQEDGNAVAGPEQRISPSSSAEVFPELSLDLQSHLHGRQTGETSFNLIRTFADEESNETVELGNEAAAMRSNNTAAEVAGPQTTRNDDLPANDNDDREDFTPIIFSTPRRPPAKSYFLPQTNFNRDEDFETQDIRDPWILDEIDTLPEEYEMEGSGIEEEYQPIADAEYAPEQPDFRQTGVIAPENFSELTNETSETFSPNIRLATPSGHAPANSALQPQNVWPDNEPEEMPLADILPEPEMTAAEMEAAEEPASAAKPQISRKKKAVAGEEEELPPDLPKIPMSDDIDEMICGIIAAYPHFGPTLICKFLEERVEPPVQVTRSAVYRYLRDANLNTRKKRLDFAGQEFGVEDFAEPA